MSQKHLLKTLAVCAALAALALVAPQAVWACGGGVICVDADAVGAATGLSWTDAYTNLQDALVGAAFGDEIWVAAGVYYPDLGAGQIDNARTSTFIMRPGVRLYGGFAATETLRIERDWARHITVLSGDVDGNDRTDPYGVVTVTTAISQSNAYHVVTGNGVTATARLDGFAITAGHANATTPDDVGAGMLIINGSPEMTNLTFSGNQAEDGGGIYNIGGAPALDNAAFNGNRATRAGGGICNSQSHFTMTQVMFNNNQAAWGGGMSNTGSHPTLINAAFRGNLATGIGGGGMHNNYSSPKLINVLFSGNQAAYSDGGGMYNTQSSPALVNVTFGGNRGNFGGGLRNNNNSSPTLINCILWGNAANNAGPQIYSSAGSTPTVSFSDVKWVGVYTGTGNLNAGPRFYSPITATAAPTVAGDYRLRPSSPAMNAGDSSSITVAADLNGNPRIVGVAVDMGAYEIQIAAIESEIFLPLMLRNWQ